MPEKEAGKQQMEERVLEISRQLLRGYSNKKICQMMSVEWEVSIRQINRYISKAYTMWRKEYKRRLRAGLNYHMAMRMKLYEEAYKGNTIKITKITKGKMVTIEKTEDQDFRLCLEIAKDIAKLEGLYIERQEVGPPGSFAEWVKAVKEEKERRRRKNSSSNR
ncbi:hypothetical protein ES705_44449 [subsurface metagenome]